MTDGFIVHSPSLAEDVRRHRPELAEKPYQVIPFPTYISEYGDLPIVTGDYPPTVLVFGQVRPYKRLDSMLAAMAAASSPGSKFPFRLVVAGPASDPVLAAHLTASSCSAVELDLRFLPKDEVLQHLALSKAVLVTQLDPNCSSALLGLSYGRVIVAPDTAFYRDLARQVGVDHVQLYRHDDLSDAIFRCSEVLASEPPTRPPSLLTWDEAASLTIDFYRRLMKS